MNARPHNSRQRVDLVTLRDLESLGPEEIIQGILSGDASIEVPAKVPNFSLPVDKSREEWTPQQKDHERRSKAQTRLLHKLREIAADASDYENDHGEAALSIGYPLLYVPPPPGRSTRIIAPLAFISINIQVRIGTKKGVTIQCAAEGIDRVVPNPALLAWIKQETGNDLENLFADEEGDKPWEELESIAKAVADQSDIKDCPDISTFTALEKIPKADGLGDKPSVLHSAVLGLFPIANQGLISDTHWMIDNPQQLQGPVTQFLRMESLTIQTEDNDADMLESNGDSSTSHSTTPRDFSSERLIVRADPCQAASVRTVRSSGSVVIHGPPGTGKSQTITNIIGDHLANGERVLFVCDKRTAIDVVKYRLDSSGLGDYCAVVHDPKREQKDLYMSMRERLNNLAETPVVPDNSHELHGIDQTLTQIHEELRAYHRSLQIPPEGSQHSFHELFGRWLELEPKPELYVSGELTSQITEENVQAHLTEIDEVLRRAQNVSYPTNPWKSLTAIEVGAFLATPEQTFVGRLQQLLEASRKLDALSSEHLPQLNETDDLVVQATSRNELSDKFSRAASQSVEKVLSALAGTTQEKIQSLQQGIEQTNGLYEEIENSPLDASLQLYCPVESLELADINSKIQALEAYLPVADRWYRFIYGKKAKAATAALSPLGLNLDAANCQKGLAFYTGARSRKALATFLEQQLALPAAELKEDSLKSHYLSLRCHVDALNTCQGRPELSGLWDLSQACMESEEYLQSLSTLLSLSAQRAAAIAEWEKSAIEVGLFREEVVASCGQAFRSNSSGTEWVEGLVTYFPYLEDIVRLESTLRGLPEALSESCAFCCEHLASYADTVTCLMKHALSNEIQQRIQQDPRLHQVDGERIDALFANYLSLTEQKRGAALSHILHLWQQRQRDRLLAGTATRLNSNGADLRNRLYVRGAKALKLRKMIDVGRTIEGGDPLFDLCPVWMSSPNTVAQIFPREPIFDVVIFDEASQCRLEEALPVLMRAQRVVIAGDPKQLPPTRFFESGIVESENDDIETTDDLFEVQISDVEDLLTAALNIGLTETYLDVHYRSTNEDLIGFSNGSFYKGRLQAIPAHPNDRSFEPPIKLLQVNGLYKGRRNVDEAKKVCDIVENLLDQPNPPSIGIACFNLTQRELIIETLDDRADQNAAFASKLDEARRRQGVGSFEGLFVKNLENVQGDERDHMIISTTFGVNEEGKFSRNFGPLSRANGGRRLNVLVTRARDTIHVVTSIPRGEYLASQDLPPGKSPNGRLLVYRYLKYAEGLVEKYEEVRAAETEEAKRNARTMLDLEHPNPSKISRAIGYQLQTTHELGGFLHWGNEGFCMDVVIRHPEKPEYVTIGILNDFSRYPKCADPVDWEVFKTEIFQYLTRWDMLRNWSPVFFRRYQSTQDFILQRHVGALEDYSRRKTNSCE